MNDTLRDFYGFLSIHGHSIPCHVSNFLVTLLIAPQERSNELLSNIYEDVRKELDSGENSKQFLFGYTEGFPIVILRQGNTYYKSHSTVIQFRADVIFKSNNNTGSHCLDESTCFDQMEFYGGSLNSLVELNYNTQKDNNHHVSIVVDTFKFDDEIELFGETVKLTIKLNYSAQHLLPEEKCDGPFSPAICLTFEKGKNYEEVFDCYSYFQKFISVLTGTSNIGFSIRLKQKKIEDNPVYTTNCYTAYNSCSRLSNRIIKLDSILGYTKKLFNLIEEKRINHILPIVHTINALGESVSVANVQYICTALEVEYEKRKQPGGKDALIEELKKTIRSTIAEFEKSHISEVGSDFKTNVESCFRYLDLTLKQKIMSLYTNNESIIDYIANKKNILTLREESISKFVDLRNDKTHTNLIRDNDCGRSYILFLTLVYSLFLKEIGMVDEKIKEILDQILR